MKLLLSAFGLIVLSVTSVFTQCDEISEKYFIPSKNQYRTAPDNALVMVDSAILLYEMRGSCIKELTTAYIVRGLALRNLNRYEESVEALNRSLEIRKEIGDSIGCASVFNNLITVAKEAENYQQALEYSSKALTLLEEYKGNKSNKYWNIFGSIYINRASIFIEIDSLSAVEPLISEAKGALADNPGGEEYIRIAEYNLGVAYSKSGKYSKAEEKLEGGQEYYQKNKDTLRLAKVMDALGTLYYEQASYEQAKVNYQESIRLYETLKERPDVITPKLNLASTYLQLDMSNRAIETAKKIQLDSSGSLTDWARLERIFIEAYLGERDMERAAFHITRLDSINQLIIARIFADPQNTSNGLSKIKDEASLADLFKTYLENDKQRMSDLLSLNQSEIQAEKDKRKFLIGLFLGVVFLGLSLSIIGADRKKFKEQELSSKNQDLVNKYLQKINSILTAFNQDFSEKRFEVNGILHDKICPEIVRVKRGLEFFLRTEDKNSINKLIHLLDSIYNDSRNLINRKENPLPPNGECLQYLKLITDEYEKNGNFKFKAFIGEGMEKIPCETAMELGIIANILLENVEKHAAAKRASLDLIRENGSVLMIIDDDGVGFDRNKVFSKKKKSKDSSLGLLNARMRVEDILNGIFSIESNMGNGTNIFIQIPVDNQVNDKTK